MNTGFLGPAVATVLTVYGIETFLYNSFCFRIKIWVATVLTVYGIETTQSDYFINKKHIIPLQQCLPFTVLKL